MGFFVLWRGFPLYMTDGLVCSLARLSPVHDISGRVLCGAAFSLCITHGLVYSVARLSPLCMTHRLLGAAFPCQYHSAIAPYCHTPYWCQYYAYQKPRYEDKRSTVQFPSGEREFSFVEIPRRAPGRKGRSVNQAAHLHLVSRFRMSGAATLCPLHAFMLRTGTSGQSLSSFIQRFVLRTWRGQETVCSAGVVTMTAGTGLDDICLSDVRVQYGQRMAAC
jgi:hypothetical protein